MAENAQLHRPAAGQSDVVPVGPDAKLEFTFDQTDANLGKDGQDLVLSFDDGATLRLQGFYDNFGEGAQPPTLVVEGQDLPGEAFLAALNDPALMPLAGPGAGAAAAMLGGGAYEEALLHGVSGVDRLEKLAFDGWGRDSEHDEQYRGLPGTDGGPPELPGGTFGLAGNSYDMNGVFVTSGMYEDWRPSQHEGDYDTKLYGKLDFEFHPTGTTVVDAIHLSNFDTGTIIVIGTPQFDGDGNLVNGVTVTGPDQVFHFTQGDFADSGVYVLPPPNSDHDMDIGVKLDLHAASSGIPGSISGSFTIVVDAVADKPTVQAAGFDDTGHVGHVDEVKETHKEYDEKGQHVIEQHMDGTEQVSVTVPFHTTVKFDDYEDGSESHYVLIEVPSLPGGAVWACPEATGTITGPDGKEYFQIPVNNAALAANDGVITVDVNLTVTGDSATVKDTDMTLKVGAMAEEHPDDSELTLDNNIAFDFKEGGADLHLDVVDGGLKITAGWASEGNNDAKHLGMASDGYAYTGAEAGATGNLADGATNTGAPITIEVGVDHDGKPEFITSVTFSYDASEGHIWQFDGTNWTDLDPDGTGSVTIDGLSASRLDGVSYRPNEGSFSDADVDISYKVDVQNEAGVQGSYSGSFSVVVDAVADLSTPVLSSATGDHDNQHYVDQARESVNDTDAHGKDGWEIDSFKLDYSNVEYGFTVHVETTFPDTDGSERHYVLVEHQPGWNLNPADLPPGYSLAASDHTGSDGKTYFRIEVDDRTQGEASLDVPLTKTGISGDAVVNLKTGSYVVETAGAGDGLPDSGREYDLGNNVAQRTDGMVAELRADVLNSTLTVKTGWASEGNNDAKHLGTASDGYRYTGAEAGSTGNLADGKTNTGAPITFSLTGGQGAGEFVSDVTFTFDGARGTLNYSGSGTLSGPVANADGTVSYTLSGVNSATVDGVRFVPATEGAQSYNDADVGMKYDVTVSNGTASHTFHGTSTVIIDAVADRPTELQIPKADGTDLSYTHVDGDGNQVPHDAATWGSEIGFQVGVSFHDIADGSETHYMLVEAKPGWSGDYDTVTINGTTFFVIDVNDAVKAALENGGYDQDGVRVEISYDGFGVPHASVTVDVNLTLPDKPADGQAPGYMQGDGQVGLASGGLAIEGEIKWDGKPDANGHDTGKIAVSGSDVEIDLGNNIALNLGSVNVNVNVVTSLPTVSISDNKIYENLTADAHKGDESFSEGAKITVGNLHEGENTEITFSFDFAKGGAGEHSFDSAPGHQDDVMRLELCDANGNTLLDGGGTPYSFPITWDGNAWTCTVQVDDAIKDLNGTDTDVILTFKPGYNYNSEDLSISYEMTVTDPASGDQISWKAGDSPDLPGLGVLVDAVAQQPLIDHDATQASYGSTGGTDAFVSGGKVDIEAKIEFRDFEDGSERHYVLVEAKVGWQAPSNTLTIFDGNGDAHEVPVKWDMQMIEGKMYYKAEVDNGHIQNWGTQGEHGEGLLEMHISMQSPSGVAAHVDFKVGGGAWEDAGYVDGEIRWDNNTAFDFVQVGLDFNKVGDFGLTPGGAVYENDTANAHLGDNTASGGTSLTVTVSHPGDVITDFHFNNYNPEVGTLYFNLPDGSRVEVNPDGSIPGNPELHGGEQFTFIPAHNYSDTDVKLSYGATITDPHSGDSHSPGHSSGIVVDAVAQKPENVDFAQDGQTLAIDWHGQEEGGKGSFTLDVAAKFEDITDGSERHYVLVETLPNTSVPGSEGTFSVYDAESGKYINYWKVPVNNADIDADGNVAVKVTVVIEGVIPGHGIHEDVRVGALAEEHPSDGEITFHNNWAYTEGGKATVDWGPGGGSGPGFWADAAYENDRPNSHLGDETPIGGAAVTFGQGAGDSVHVEWTGDGYFKDSAGNVFEGGTAELSGANGPFRFVPTGHSDEDIKVTYTVTDADGHARSGTGTIVVDAVANKPEGLDDNAFVDYGHAADGTAWTAVGKPDGHGNDGGVKVHVTGEFVDNDGSEKHYALVEAQPGFNVPGGEMVYIEGHAYYRVEMAKNPDGSYAADADGKQYADVVVQITNPTAIGKAGHDLMTGLMAEETNYGTAGNLEAQTDNNVSWTLGGNAHIDVSFVDSSASVSVPGGGVMERSEGDLGFPVTLSAHLGEDDNFGGMTITAKGAGDFSVEDPQGVGGWEVVGNKLVITDFDAIGKIQVTFTPETHSDEDISFSWSAKFTNERSGDEEARGGSPYVVVDAVANAPVIAGTHVESDHGALGAYAGEGANVTTSLNFEDTSGREVHYAVLQQGQFIGKADNVWLADGALINGQPAEIVTMFDQGGKPYYAVVVPNEALDANGNVDVTWHVTAPNISHDMDAKLLMGGFSVEPNTGAGANKEVTLDNNWAETVQPVTVKIGQFDTTEVRFGADGQLVENDASGAAIHLQAPAAGTNEIITQTEFTFTQSGAGEGDVIGTVWYQGEPHEIVVGADGKGHLTLEFGDQAGEGYDPAADFRFTATDASGNSCHNSNPVQVDTNSTVKDVFLGEEREFGDSQVFNVRAVADAPTDVNGMGPADAAGAGESVTVMVSASFADLDGSERHYVLVEAREGWACDESKGTYTDESGKTYFMVEVSGTDADVTKDVTLITPKEYVLGDHPVELAVGGLAQEKAAGSDNTHGFAPGGSVTVDIHDTANLTLVSNNPAGGVAEGGELSFTLTLANDQGQLFTAGEEISVTLSLTGVDGTSPTAEQLVADGWTPQGDGSFLCTLVLPAGSSTAELTIAVEPNGVLGSTDAAGGMSVELIGSNVPDALAGNVAVSGGVCEVPILDADAAHLVMGPGETVASGEVSLDLHLQNVDGDLMTAATAVTVVFAVDNNLHDFVPAALDQPIQDPYGNTLTWTHDGQNDGYILTVTLEPGQSTAHIAPDVFHTQDGTALSDPDHVLHLNLQSVGDERGDALPGLDASIHMGEGEAPLHPGDHIDFSFVDAEHGVDALGLDGQPHLDDADALGLDGLPHTDGTDAGGEDSTLDANAGIMPGNEILVGGSDGSITMDNLPDPSEQGGGHPPLVYDLAGSLTFEDLLGGSVEAEAAINSLLSASNNGSATWEADASGHGGVFTATDGNGASLQLSVAETVTMTMSYQSEGQSCTQNVQFENFNMNPQLQGELDVNTVTQMLQEIIKVGGVG